MVLASGTPARRVVGSAQETQMSLVRVSHEAEFGKETNEGVSQAEEHGGGLSPFAADPVYRDGGGTLGN